MSSSTANVVGMVMRDGAMAARGRVVSTVGNDRFTYFDEMPRNGIFLGFMKGDITRKSSVNHEMRTLWFRILPCVLTQSPCGAPEGAGF